jgi:hypothetical protein
MLKHFVWICFLAVPILCFATDTPTDIQVRPSGSDAYVLTLTSAAITNVPAAQAVLMPTAQKICAGKTVQLGHYKFESKAPPGVPANDNSAKTSFVIDQEISCADSVPQEVKATPTDPNWHPSDADYQSVIDTLTKYFAAKDSGNVAGSYTLLDDGMGLSLKEWKSSSDDFTAKTGAAVSHKVMKLTWYKDPQNAPEPGIYAAADFVDHYDKATDCGYLSMHQKPDGSFLVIHEQDGFIPNQSNMTPAQIAEYKTKLGCVGDEAASLPEAKEDVIGYSDVATARKELLSRKDGQAHTEGSGWLVVYFPSEYTIWTFTPESDPAYPAVVRRVITQGPDKNTYINMSVLCQASKAACDNLVRQFNELNDRMKASLSHH